MTNRGKAIAAAAGVGTTLILRQAFARRSEADLRGNVVLITGGSKGLGVALARRFAAEGCRLALCARSEEELHRIKRELEARNVEVLPLVCDVGDRDSVEQMVAAAEKHYGRIDILVNNAGQIQVGPMTAMTVEDFDSAMRVMFWGVVYPTLAVLPSFLKRKSGRIVTVTSVGGKVSVPHLVPYACAKFAATGFSEGLRSELKKDGIVVTTIAPGLMRTGSFLNALFKGDRAAESRWFSLGASLPLVSMSAEDAARRIVTATKRGESERILSGPARLLSTSHGVFPGFTTDLLGVLASAFLPGSRRPNASKRGFDLPALRTPVMRTLLTLGRSAAQHYLQRPRPV